MKASRELDALVAEKVMGEPKPTSSVESEHLLDWVKYDIPQLSRGRNWTFHPWSTYPWQPISFTTEIANAWRIIGEWNSLGWHWEIASGKSKIHVTVLTNADENFAHSGKATTAPLAICLAALKACGVELEAGEGEG